jgi:GT2 family glycosyltransferase
MSIVDGRSVVLITFAGRRDRMELLARYVAEALRRNLVDEWHIWNFARDEADDRWLKYRFPKVGRTADDLVYQPAGTVDPESKSTGQWVARVRARHDVHIAIKARDIDSPSFELVVGGWENQRTALLRVDASEVLVKNHGDRTRGHDRLADVFTPGILLATTFRDVRLALDPSSLTLTVDNATVLRCGLDIQPCGYDIYVKTGYGSDGEWRFPELSDVKEYLYHSTERWRAGFADAIQFYSSRAYSYADTVLLKCDDDILYFELDHLEDFIRFRIENPEYFLVSANVVNHNVCAYYQQQHRAIPRSVMELELPPQGFGGRLWESSALATALHHHFLDNRNLFEQVPASPIEWSGRLAMHFVAWMGEDLSYMSGEMVDEERALSVQIPAYLHRRHCIYPRFLVSHLSSGKQASGENHEHILWRYWQLALENKVATAAEVDSREVPEPVEASPSRTADEIAGARRSRAVSPGRREPGGEPNIAIIVLNFNTAEMTDRLADYLNNTLDYERKRVYVIDNGSWSAPESATHVLPRNLGFTNGMYAGYTIASDEDDYDAFWLLNSDVRFDYGGSVLRELVSVLFSSADNAQIAPQHNSWLASMEQAEEVASIRAILEPTATLIKRSTIERLGFWDLDMPLGYGIDHDYGYRIRSAGLLSILTNRARIYHEQHRSMDDFDDYSRRGLAEEDTVLSAKYGADWRRILFED